MSSDWIEELMKNPVKTILGTVLLLSIHPRFRNLEVTRNFVDGRAIVSLTDPLNANYGVINKTGNWVVQPTYDSIASYRDGLARVRHRQSFEFIDKSGKVVIPHKFNQVNSFSDGLAAFR